MARPMLLVSAALFFALATVVHGESSIPATSGVQDSLFGNRPPPTKRTDLRRIDPNRRMNELINQSDRSDLIPRGWIRIWCVDQPSHLTPERVHGGIQ
jgi:hypothetical protein